MAGEIEEPFSLSFQANSLHSGSISFGRFEAESLSWERRSSFSHNRYLEEVEKYSKPGSVTEKKAYFEAHFKRKALLSQSSSECQSGVEYQTSENDTTENMGYGEEFEHINEGSQSVQFDKSSDGSEYDGNSEVMELDREGIGEPQFEYALNVTSVVQGVSEHVNTEEAHQTQTESLPVIDAVPGKEVRENLNDEDLNVDSIPKDIHPSTNSHTSMKDGSASLEHQQESSLKVGAKLGSKIMKPKSKSPVNGTRVQRNISSELSKDSAKKPFRTDKEVSRSTKTEKQSSQTAVPITRSVHRTSKPEDSKISKSQVIHDNISEKDLNTKRVIEPKPFVSEKIIPKARQTANRPKQAENSTNPGMKQSSAGFSFKSDKRAERRKEFCMKLEEKMHAKEAEMNQIQAKKLEKSEAEIKQFRKSLKFKATPMPSFYHEPVQRGSDKNKIASSDTKSSKLRSKSTPVRGSSGKSPSYAKAGNDQDPFNTGTVKACNPPHASAATNNSLTSVPSETGASSQTPLTNRCHPPQDEVNSEVTGIEEHTKENDMNMQKHRVSGSSKVTKGQSSEGKRKVVVGISNKIVRKDMKGVGNGSASGMGHLTVGVAS